MTSSQTTNAMGDPNSKQISASHFDLNGNSLLNTETIYFSDGTSQSTAPSGYDLATILLNGNSAANLSITDLLSLGFADGTTQNTAFNASDIPTLTGSNAFTGANTFSTAAVGDNSTGVATTAFVANEYAPSASPALTGNPTGVTATAGDKSTSLATTLFVFNEYAPINDPTFTGTPKAPAPASGDASTQVATTQFVADSVSGGSNWTADTSDPSQPFLYYNDHLSGYVVANGSAAVTGATPGSIVANNLLLTSDRRIKHNLRPIEHTVDDMRPVAFYNQLTGHEDMGLIADELAAVCPLLVAGEKDDPESLQHVNYIGLIAILIKEVQELKKRLPPTL
jgi:hypothetical protein